MARPKKNSEAPQAKIVEVVETKIETKVEIKPIEPVQVKKPVEPVEPFDKKGNTNPSIETPEEDTKGFRKFSQQLFADYALAKAAFDAHLQKHAKIIKGGQIKFRIRRRPSNVYHLCAYSVGGKEITL